LGFCNRDDRDKAIVGTLEPRQRRRIRDAVQPQVESSDGVIEQPRIPSAGIVDNDRGRRAVAPSFCHYVAWVDRDAAVTPGFAG
jgi:hypothetical protein